MNVAAQWPWALRRLCTDCTSQWDCHVLSSHRKKAESKAESKGGSKGHRQAIKELSKKGTSICRRWRSAVGPAQRDGVAGGDAPCGRQRLPARPELVLHVKMHQPSVHAVGAELVLRVKVHDPQCVLLAAALQLEVTGWMTRLQYAQTVEEI